MSVPVVFIIAAIFLVLALYFAFQALFARPGSKLLPGMLALACFIVAVALMVIGFLFVKFTALPSETTPTPVTSGPSGSPAVDTGLKFIDWDPCKNGPNPGIQINYLEENGDYRSSSFMALPLNLAEVSSGMRYRAPAPAGSDIHSFTAINDGNRNGDGYTYEVVGGDNVVFVSTAYTVWCPDLAHKTDHAGLSQVLDALHLPNPNPIYGGIWLPLPASGFIPFPK